MSGLQIWWEVEGVEQLNRSLSKYSELLSDLKDAWPQIKKDFYHGEEIQFDTETGDGGWKQLSPSYAAWKRRHYPGRKIMVLKERLKDALTKGTRDLTWGEQKLKLTATVKVPYAYQHHHGIGVPKRKIIWFSEDTRQTMYKTILKWTLEQQKKANVD